MNTSCKVDLSGVAQNSINENIGSSNGLVPSGNKPLLESVSTQIYVYTETQWVKQASSWSIYYALFYPDLSIFVITYFGEGHIIAIR